MRNRNRRITYLIWHRRSTNHNSDMVYYDMIVNCFAW